MATKSASRKPTTRRPDIAVRPPKPARAPTAATKRTKDARLEGRIALAIKQIIAEAAVLAGRSFTDFVISAAHEQALRVIRDHDVMTLSTRDAKAFQDALNSPPAPSARLAKAAKRFKSYRTA